MRKFDKNEIFPINLPTRSLKDDYGIQYITWPCDIDCLLSESENNYVSSIIQKLNWNIDDFNSLINNIESRKDIVYFIVVCDWIKESCKFIYKIYEKYSNGFNYSSKDKRKAVNNYFEAIRSFIVAHPLDTTKHDDQGYSGEKKCIDISLRLSGVDKAFCNFDTDDADFYLVYYEDEIAYKKEGHYFSEIYLCVYYNVEWIRSFGEYLSENKKLTI